MNNIGIISGGGLLPVIIGKNLINKNFNVIFFVIEDFFNINIYKELDVKIINLKSAKKIIQSLKSNNINNIIMAGNIVRPSLTDLSFDFDTFKLAKTLLLNKTGDNELLTSIKIFFINNGFNYFDWKTYCPDLFANKDILTTKKPSALAKKNLNKALSIFKSFGKLDIGQSLIIQNQIVLGLEAIEGTDNLIIRCKNLKKSGDKGVLVKLSKYNQSNILDIPTIGENTIKLLNEYEYEGIYLEKNNCLIIDKENTIKLANKLIFLFLLVIKLNKVKKIFICCTEQSGENIVFNICKRLKKYNYQIDGVCGKLSEQYFTNKYYDINLFKSLGLLEILLSIPKFIKLINKLNDRILLNNYDLIICVDSPDFNYHLAKKIRKNNYHKHIIQIVAPTVWAWRKGRTKKFSRVFNEIFTLFSFEKYYFEREGLKSTFIGHPISIIEETNYHNKKKDLIAFLPGSRDNEVNKLFPYLEYIYDYLLTNNITDYKIFIPTLPHLIDKITHFTKDWKIETIISINNEKNKKLYNNVFISVTCSGTASLEISKRLIPQIVFYKLNFLTYFIFSFLVDVKFAHIINILSNKMIIKEIVNRNLNKKNLLEAFDTLLNDQNFRDQQILEVQRCLPEIQSKINPYDICEKRIMEIISTAT